jgi:pimeloyl-ACP methyl ester carboxylesterase
MTLLTLLAPGCAEIRVRETNTLDLMRAWEANLIGAEQLSIRTLQTLRRFDLERAFRRDAVEAHRQLEVLACHSAELDVLFAAAELSHYLGANEEKRNPAQAAAYFYLCAGYAYHYLFPPDANPQVEHSNELLRIQSNDNPYDPRFRLACDLYNTGLAKCIRTAQRAGRLDPGARLVLPTPDGQGFHLQVMQHGFAWRPEEFGPLRFCSDFAVEGLENRYRGYGLGVPLMGTRPGDAPSPKPLRYPREISFPVTAFFRFHGTVADLRARRSGTLELYNPLAVDTVHVDGRTVTLETDLTSPLAYHLAHTDLDQLELLGFLFADQLDGKKGLYSLEPYQPGKIPVVMVHGLLSTPATWAPMFNDLRADPLLRSHFQFWLYRYPTGQPYLATAAELRANLQKVRKALDPEGADPALDQMVFVGHSMGGLISELLTMDSGEDFWRLVSRRPIDSLKLKLETRSLIHEILFFDRLPYVRRVIFLGTPHLGSKLSPSWPARVLKSCVRLPRALLGALEDAMLQNPGFWRDQNGDATLTSIDLLRPGSPALELLATRPKPDGVAYHSVIGQVSKRSLFRQLALAFGEKEPSDGVVPVRSAQRADVESELIIEADHTHIHQHPLAVLEVRRILLEHLQQVRAQQQ